MTAEDWFTIIIEEEAIIIINIFDPVLMWFVADDEGSAADVGKKFTKCSTCKYGAECDEDSEDVWWEFVLYGPDTKPILT